MRINTGRAKGRRLRSVPGNLTRPVTDRVKQAVFNILGDDVRGSSWLDLFAGTGAIGIEALSRGAAHSTFLDIEPLAIKTIRQNLAVTQLEAGATVIRQDAFQFLRAPANARYDFIYVAPPQYQGLWERAVAAIDSNPDWLADGGAVIVQIHPREYHELTLQTLELVDRRRYGATMLCFYERRSEFSSAVDDTRLDEENEGSDLIGVE
ncbi:MAG: 16S rRNA (guanine(966)-N(2))-methyltransferase RsmD [Anaerolineae bacterium]|nr:16S rRNA (guanine(966)-N(2))-methyltransferase RsmD [Thermoflexales bacterium]MDW8406419.1 16S rRNA (guanine(966)-N(2))-methyltransferase RsmD [Anaerolineae bacterium]